MAEASSLPIPPDIVPERTLSAPQWGMLAFLLSEVAFFGTLIVAYVTFIGQDTTGPTPRDALSFPLVIASTICLLSSSFAVHLAEGSLKLGAVRSFQFWWCVTILLGIVFLLFTAYEWYDLIVHKQLSISRNLFGTTYFTLVGFHAFHVSAGIITMLIVLWLSLRGTLGEVAVQMTSWYWHFVDLVWIAVFLIVYVGGKLGGT